MQQKQIYDNTDKKSIVLDIKSHFTLGKLNLYWNSKLQKYYDQNILRIIWILSNI